MNEPSRTASKMPGMTAMILAAGLGTRMRPLTLAKPKPLIEVAGRTLLDHAIEAACAGGARRMVVNVHYLADQIEAHLMRSSVPALVSDERDELQDSGGGVARALPIIGPDPFMILNADTFWQEDVAGRALSAMASALDSTSDMVLLLVAHENAVGFDGKGDFHLDGLVPRRRGGADHAPYIYAGAILARPCAFDDVPHAPFSLNLVFDRLLETGRLRAVVLDGLWLHVGTPDAIPLAEAALDRRRRAA